MGLRTLPTSCNRNCILAAQTVLASQMVGLFVKVEEQLGGQGWALDVGRMAGAGHSPNVERPALVAKLVLHFAEER